MGIAQKMIYTTSLAKFDLNDPKNYRLVVLHAMSWVANETIVNYQHKTEQHSSQCVNHVRLAKGRLGRFEVFLTK